MQQQNRMAMAYGLANAFSNYEFKWILYFLLAFVLFTLVDILHLFFLKKHILLDFNYNFLNISITQ